MRRHDDNIEIQGPSRSSSYEYIPAAHQRTNRPRHGQPYDEGHYEDIHIPIIEDNSSANHARLDHHVNEIVHHMEQDEALMQDNPISEQLRMETLRELPQCLTMKRSIKAKLTKSVSKNSKHHPLSFLKQLKYRISMTFSKMQTTIKDIIYSFELWYSSLKSIEGYFGSGVATYFRFLRLLFIMNFVICIPTIIFLVLPQLIYRFYEPDNTLNENSDSTTVRYTTTKLFENIMKAKADAYDSNAPFRFSNIITGEGFFTNTTLYYGFYTNGTVNVISNLSYSMPHAYFFTMVFLYGMMFITFSIRMAKSYRHSFIETSGGLKNHYAHKIFCGWDYSIATKEGADLKSTAIYNEIMELLSHSDTDTMDIPFKNRFWTFGIQVTCHLIILTLLGVIAFVMWELLGKYSDILNSDSLSHDLGSTAVVTSIIVTLIMNLGPLLFTWIIRFEDYKSPRTTLYISLMRTFLLEIVVIGVLLTFWFRNSEGKHCWETLLGQEIYRLIFIDFLFSLLFVLITEVLRHVIYKYWWRQIGVPEFDIARHTLQIIYNQTLFWVGLYFAPLLCIIVTIKFWLIWYVKKLGCMYFCKPSSKSWRAAQTETVFLVMTFFALFLILVCFGYVMTQVHTSTCGPFQGYDYMYEMLVTGVLQLQKGHDFVKFLVYLTKPGVISGLLIALGVRVYFLRAKSNAQRDMVELLQDMLLIEARDKEFLLNKISKITNGKWMYNLNKRSHTRNKLHSEPSNTWHYQGDPSGRPHSSRQLGAVHSRHNPRHPPNRYATTLF